MRFSNGCWLNKTGLEVSHPKDVYEFVQKENSVEVLVPCCEITSRGATLGGPVLTYEISAPLKDVLKVRISHYKGTLDKGPHFDVHNENLPIDVEGKRGRVVC